MVDKQIIEEKYKYLMVQSLGDLKCKSLELDYDEDDEGKLIEYSFVGFYKYLGAINGEVWGIRNVLDKITDKITYFFERYKLLSSGKIAIKSDLKYYIDDLYFTELHMVADEKFECWIMVKLYIDYGK